MNEDEVTIVTSSFFDGRSVRLKLKDHQHESRWSRHLSPLLVLRSDFE